MSKSPFRPARSSQLWWSFFRVSAMNEMQYRSNFFLQLLQSLLTLGVGLIALAIVFGRTTNLNGWTRPELLAVVGVFTMVGGIINTFVIPNMLRLVDDIQKGTLDHTLMKPAGAQTLVSIRQVSIWQLVDVVAGLVVLIVALVQLGDSSALPRRITLFVGLLALGCWTIYCFWLVLASCAFWLTRVHEMQDLFQGLFRSGQYPVRIYPSWMRFGLTFIVPIGFAVTVPAEAATGRLSTSAVAFSVGAAAFMGLLSRWVWHRGIKRYSGASA